MAERFLLLDRKAEKIQLAAFLQLGQRCKKRGIASLSSSFLVPRRPPLSYGRKNTAWLLNSLLHENAEVGEKLLAADFGDKSNFLIDRRRIEDTEKTADNRLINFCGEFREVPQIVKACPVGMIA